MKCPECGYTTTYDNAVKCIRCGATLEGDNPDSVSGHNNPFRYIDDQETHELNPGYSSSNPLNDDTLDQNIVQKDEESPFAGEKEGNTSYTEFYKRIKVSEGRESRDKRFRPASLYERFFALAIDLLLLFVGCQIVVASGFYFLGVNISEEFSAYQHLIIPAYVIIFVLLSTYFLMTSVFFGRSVGKMALGISIVPEHGTELSSGTSFIRWVGYYISAVPVFAGFFWAVIDPENRTWHDKLAGTYVVKDDNQ